MLKLVFGLPILIAVMLTFVLGGVLVLPLLGVGAAICAIALTIGIFACVLRLMAAIVLGVGGLLFGVLGFAFVIAGAALVLALAGALVHLVFPVLVIVAIIWLIRRASKPAPAAPVAIGHG